jgi:hypothetical protein
LPEFDVAIFGGTDHFAGAVGVIDGESSPH